MRPFPVWPNFLSKPFLPFNFSFCSLGRVPTDLRFILFCLCGLVRYDRPWPPHSIFCLLGFVLSSLAGIRTPLSSAFPPLVRVAHFCNVPCGSPAVHRHNGPFSPSLFLCHPSLFAARPSPPFVFLFLFSHTLWSYYVCFWLLGFGVCFAVFFPPFRGPVVHQAPPPIVLDLLCATMNSELRGNGTESWSIRFHVPS